jgi:pyrroloquinoline quinone biosynthesis protein D
LPGSQSLIVAAITAGSRPRLRRGVRLVFDATRGTRVLLYPEGVIVPNETAAEVLGRCDGVVTVGAITAELAAQYDGVQAEDVIALLTRLAERRFVEVADEPGPDSDGARPSESASAYSSSPHPGVTHPADIAPADGAPAAEGDPR